MKIKNLNIKHKAAVLTAGGIILGQGAFSAAFFANDRYPFVKNDYTAHLVQVQETTKDGDFTYQKYAVSSYDTGDAILLKRPYEENTNGKYEREVLIVPKKCFSNVEYQYTKENIDNQELLLEQDYISEIIDLSNEATDMKIFTYDEVEELPQENPYEISCATFDVYLDDTITVNDRGKDFIVTSLYISGLLAILGGGVALNKIFVKEKEDSKVKKLK